MKNTYAQFYILTDDKELTRALGMDAYHWLDGRLTLINQKQAVIERAAQLLKVRPEYVAFRIVAGYGYKTEVIKL